MFYIEVKIFWKILYTVMTILSPIVQDEDANFEESYSYRFPTHGSFTHNIVITYNVACIRNISTK